MLGNSRSRMSKKYAGGMKKMDVYKIEKGHARSTILKRNGKMIVAFGVAKDYAEPGTILPKEEPTEFIFGFYIDDSAHLRTIANNLLTMAKWIDEEENVE